MDPITLIPSILGALGGAAGGSSTSMRVLAPPSASELAGEKAITQNLPIWQQLVNVGPGQQDVVAGLGSSRDLASMLQSYAQGGFLPGQQDWQTASQFSQRAFQPQEVALNQAFQGEQQRTAQLAAQLGRPVNDPILQAKLAQERSQGMERLGASRSAYEAQFAQNLPMQRLGFMGQLADVRNSLASQAMANRQALVSAGSQLENAGRAFRAQTAGVRTTTGGGVQGATTGILGGLGAGMNADLKKFLEGGARDIWNNISENIFGPSEATLSDRMENELQDELNIRANRANQSATLVPQVPRTASFSQTFNIPQALSPGFGLPSGNIYNYLGTGLQGGLSNSTIPFVTPPYSTMGGGSAGLINGYFNNTNLRGY